jgi:hypothetical protein
MKWGILLGQVCDAVVSGVGILVCTWSADGSASREGVDPHWLPSCDVAKLCSFSRKPWLANDQLISCALLPGDNGNSSLLLSWIS